MKESRIVAVDHVHLEAHSGLEEPMLWFYGELAELETIDSERYYRASLGFKSERIKLWLHFHDTPHLDSVMTRVTILVETLETVVEILEQRKHDFIVARGLSMSEREISTLDPSGNRVIFKQYWPFAMV